MTTRQSLIAVGWITTAAAAFFLGKSSSNTPNLTDNQSSERTDTRVAVRTTSDSSSGTRLQRRSTVSSAVSSREALAVKMSELANLSDPIERARAFLDLADQLSSEEFEDAIAAFRDLGMTRERMGEYSILLTGWARIDPLGALTYAKDNTGTPFARKTILASWAQQSPDSAIAWARENYEGKDDQANPWLVGVIQGMAGNDVDRATALLSELPYSRGRGEALGFLIAALEQKGPEASKAWIAQIDDERLQAGAASRFAERLSQNQDPKKALEWANTLGPEALKQAAPEVIENWIEEDKNSAMAWVRGQSEEIQAAAGPNFIRSLEIDEAQDWLSDHIGKPAYDATIQSFAWKAMEKTPELGADWIMKITDDNQRTRSFHRVLRRWQRSDKDGLIEYVKNNEVPDSIRRRLDVEATGS